MVIAPLSCNTLSKMAMGSCDNLLMAVYLSATCPVMVAPAMDEDMWNHPAVQHNIETIRKHGVQVMPVGTGELASGLFGLGRMAEPEELVGSVVKFFSQTLVLKGRKAVVTAGPTYEPIDPVRFVGNYSSGKMGVEIARALQARGAEVDLVLGPVSDNLDISGLQVHKVRSAEEMYQRCLQVFPGSDIAVMAAAVADYTPIETSREKIKKKEESWTLAFRRTPDILKSLGERKNTNQFLVGFALETQQEKAYALEKLHSKNADMIVLNSLRDPGAGFGTDTNKITIFDKKGNEHAFGIKSKQAVAQDIVDAIIRLANI
jgi:phosphopantothenoylcysteine decarboxylase/phosphopantothenate--cysteine ligase